MDTTQLPLARASLSDTSGLVLQDIRFVDEGVIAVLRPTAPTAPSGSAMPKGSTSKPSPENWRSTSDRTASTPSPMSVPPASLTSGRGSGFWSRTSPTSDSARRRGATCSCCGTGGLHASLLEWANGGPDHEAEGDQAQHVWAGEVRPAAPASTVRSMTRRLTKSWGEP
jgi:hypothetical protein